MIVSTKTEHGVRTLPVWGLVCYAVPGRGCWPRLNLVAVKPVTCAGVLIDVLRVSAVKVWDRYNERAV